MMSGGEVWAILLAAGSSTRFGAPKQFLPLGGRRLVDVALDQAIRACDAVALVLPPGRRWDGAEVAAVVSGGATRAASVRAGLAALPPSAAIVVIHDAAHPLAGERLYRSVIEAVRQGAPAAAPVLPPTESLVLMREDHAVAAVPKAGIGIIQTPHAFRAEILRAHQGEGVEAIDEVALLLGAGVSVRLVPGDPRNLHVTVPEELAMVAALLEPPLDRVGTHSPDTP